MTKLKSCSVLILLILTVLLFASCFEGDGTQTSIEDQTSGVFQTENVQTDEQTSFDKDETYPEQTTQDVITVPKDPVRISLVAMGDNLIHSPIFKQASLGGGKYDFLPKYKDVSEMISAADIAYINQETPMCGEEYGYHNYPQFNTPQQMGHDLVSLGFDVICFANNHILDQSSKGLEKMLDFTETLDALTVGAYRNEEDAQSIRVLECKGVRIAFLAYTYDTNISPLRSSDTVVPLIERERIERDVEKAKMCSDVIIASMHWGKENKYTTTDDQKQYAQLLADLGVDVILGHHPHVIQPIEWIQGVNGNKTLCYYSLGNGINCQDYLKNMVGITACFDIVYQEGEQPYIENASCIPTFCYQSTNYKNVQLFLLENLTDDMTENHHCNSKGNKVTVESARKIVTDTICAEFLPEYLKKESN